MPPIHGINTARAVCTLYVVAFWHLLDYASDASTLRNNLTYHLTVTSLATFSLLSGFLLSPSADCRSVPAVLAFYRSRLVKLYPPYALALILFFALGLCNASTTIRALFLISVFVKPAAPTLWFMSMLFLFYLSLPGLMRAAGNVYGVVSLAIGIWFVLYCVEALTGQLDQRVLIYLPAFLAGAYLRKHNPELLIGPVGRLVALILLGLFASMQNPATDNIEQDLLSAPYAMVSAIVVFYVCVKYTSRIGSARIIVIISNMAFIAYLFHRPVYQILQHVYSPDSGRPQIFNLILIYVPVMLISSLVIKAAFDRALTLRP